MGAESEVYGLVKDFFEGHIPKYAPADKIHNGVVTLNSKRILILYT